MVWVPNASGQYPAATAAADPDEEPPGVCSGLRGLRVGPGAKYANSVETVLPRIRAPARFRAATAADSAPASAAAGSRLPPPVGMPSTWKMSLTPTNEPNRGGRLSA